jgi:tryptophan-rich sensory protein
VDEPGLTLAAAAACPLAVGLPFVLGSLSGIATKDAVRSSWYTGMRAPAYRPPRQVGNGFDQA